MLRIIDIPEETFNYFSGDNVFREAECLAALHFIINSKSYPKVGHWIHERGDLYECSECNSIYTSFEPDVCDAKFCPKCGSYNDNNDDCDLYDL